MQRYLTASEAREYLNVCRTTLDRFGRECGCIRRIGRAVRFDRTIIDQYLEAQTGHEPEPEPAPRRGRPRKHSQVEQ